MNTNSAATLDDPPVETAPAVTAREIRQCYQRFQPGSAEENDWIESHLPLVKTIVGRVAMTLPAHVDHQDLYSAGLVGLLNAARQFDPDCGTSFETYARVRIRGGIMDELRRMDWVPRSVHAKARQVQHAMQELEQKIGRVPTEDEMARAMKLSSGEYEQLLGEIRPAAFVSLDAVHDSEGDAGMSYAECIADPRQENPVENVSRRELARLIAERIEDLPEMQRKVLALYYFEGLRLREIAEAAGLTESRICQIHAQAVLAIRGYVKRFEAVNA